VGRRKRRGRRRKKKEDDEKEDETRKKFWSKKLKGRYHVADLSIKAGEHKLSKNLEASPKLLGARRVTRTHKYLAPPYNNSSLGIYSPLIQVSIILKRWFKNHNEMN